VGPAHPRHGQTATLDWERSRVNLPFERPTLVLNPPDDDAFTSLAEGLVEGGQRNPIRFQDDLRVNYPSAIVRRRELAGESVDIWYVYRDGHWVHPGTPMIGSQPASNGEPN
jgi:hypothetical protein